MDFFDLRSQQGPPERVQRFGRRTADHYQSLYNAEPTPSFASIPDSAITRRNDLFLRPMREYIEMPEQQDITGLQSYFQRSFVPPDLPIRQYRDEIVDTIKGNMVTIITAPTGSGKSTQVPQYILDDEYRTERRHCKIVVTQPRRVAAISLANRVLSERNLDPLGNELGQGTLIGYQIGMDKKVNEDTRLMYMTTGVLLRKLINAQTVKEFTHIILDEVHERDKDTDFLLLLIKRMLCKYGLYCVRVVVMSATVDANKFAKYFQTLDPEYQVPCPAPIIPIKEQMFSVTVFYLDDIRASLRMADDTDDGSDGYNEPSSIRDKMYKLAKELIKYFDEVDKLEPGNDGNMTDRGSVLVFLPGIFEIESMQQALKNDRCSEDYDIICLHSTIPRQYQMKVFEKPQPGRRKVILSTNIAESSITVPDIKYVVDFCLSKELYADSGSGMSSLKYVWAPKSSLDQRKGRAGRVSRGRCYRLIYRNFLKELNDYTTPEMQRCSVEQLILWCKMLDIGDPEEMLSYALDPPDLNKLREGALLLLEVGALVLPKGSCIDNPMDQNLTFLGHVMGSMPLDVRLSRLIMFGLVFDCLCEAVIMAACLSLPAFLEIPYNNKEQKLKSYVARMKKAKGTFSDPIMMLNVFNDWYNLYSEENKGKARDYCRLNFLNYNRICEVASLVQDLYSCLRQMNVPDHLSRERQHTYTGQQDQYELLFRLKLALAGANYPFYFVQNKSFLDKENCMRTFGAKSPSDTVMYTGMRLNVKSNSELERKYRQDVSSFFKDVFDPVKRLTLESNRLYVTFDMVKESVVCKSVYYALKTNKIRGLSLTLESKRESNLPVASIKSYELLEENELIKVTVTYIESPTKFFVQIRDPKIRGNFDELHQQLQREVQRPVRVRSQELRENMYGLANFEDNDRTLYRVKALLIDPNFIVKVNYLDFGNSKWINANMFFKIPSKFLTGCPFQAVECSIEGICPTVDSRSLSSAETWDRKFVDNLRPILENKHFDAKVHYLLDNVLHLDLFEGSASLKRWLVENKQTPVTVATEDYRTEYARMMLGGNEVRLESIEVSHEMQEEDPHFKAEKCVLSGPTSPYEVEYCGLNHTARSYRTIVDPNSVCSITICHNPSDDFTEMLSASTVALSGSGCRVQLRGVTQHLPIRGFPDLMVLLFSPKVQLHTTPSRLNYVGCIAGLGIDRNGDPLWPDHDLQVTFDHRILSSDIDQINSIRLVISNILAKDDDDPSKLKFIESQITKYQYKIKEDVGKLRKALEGRQRSIPHYENLVYSWRPDNFTYNSLELYPNTYHGEDEDVVRPHSTLYFTDRSEDCLQIEPNARRNADLHEKMKKRVSKLQRYGHKLNETTSVNQSKYLECKLCKLTFDRCRELAAHIETDAHLTEVRRLDYWPNSR